MEGCDKKDCSICYPDMDDTKKIPRDKPDLSRLLEMPITMECIVRALEHGETSEKGRSRLSWKKYRDDDGLVSAALRHLTAWQNGEEFDPKSKLNHVASALCNLAMLAETCELVVRKEEVENDEEERSSNKHC